MRFSSRRYAWWGRWPRSLSSWHKGHCLSAKSSFLRPTSPLILCCTLNRSLILTRTSPYHAWRQASSVCTETENSLRDFFFFLDCICPSISMPSANQPVPCNLSKYEFNTVPCRATQVLCTGMWYLSQQKLKGLPLFFCSISNGSMHSSSEAVAFSQGDGCCGVHKAPYWHLHKEKWMPSDEVRKRTACSGYHVNSSSEALLDSHLPHVELGQEMKIKIKIKI